MFIRPFLMLCLPAVLLLTSCQSRTPRPTVEEAASAAVGVGVPLIFQTAPQSMDVADERSATLSLLDAVRLTLQNHAGIQSALAAVRVAEADAHQAGLLPNPILTLVGHFPRNGVAAELEVGIAVDLVAVLQRPGRISVADNRLRETAAGAVITVLDVVAETQSTYHAVQALQATVPLLHARRDLLARLQDLSRSRLEFGQAGRLESVTVDAQREEIEAEIDDVLLDLTEQRLVLARLIGQPSSTALLRVDPWQAPAAKSVREMPWISAALQRRPEIEARRWDLAALGADPRLSTLAAFTGTSIGADLEKQGGWAIGPTLAIPLPLFDWGQAQREKVRALQIQSLHRLTDTQREVIEQVRRACAVYNESVHELERVRTRLIPLQEQRRELAETALRAGQADVTVLILAEQDLAAARARAIMLERKNAIALVRLERAVGGAGVAAEVIKSVPDATSTTVISVAQTAAPAVSPVPAP